MIKYLKTIALALSFVFIAGCNFSFDYDNSKSKYRSLIEMPDGRLILPSGFSTGYARDFLIDIAEDRDYHFIIENFGGSAYDMITFVNRIQELQSKGYKITTETYGYAMSAGTTFFLLGDERILHSGASLMFHGAGMNGYGGRSSLKNPESLQEFQRISLQLIDDEMIAILKEKTLMNDGEIQFWMYDLDYNFMSSKQAKKLNVATKIIK